MAEVNTDNKLISGRTAAATGSDRNDSGISSPRAIRANFQDATFYGMPLMESVRLDTMVTVVDCSTFMDYLEDTRGGWSTWRTHRRYSSQAPP